MRRFVFLLLLFVAAILLYGCGQVKDEDVERPWTKPEGWEHNIGLGPFSPD